MTTSNLLALQLKSAVARMTLVYNNNNNNKQKASITSVAFAEERYKLPNSKLEVLLCGVPKLDGGGQTGGTAPERQGFLYTV